MDYEYKQSSSGTVHVILLGAKVSLCNHAADTMKSVDERHKMLCTNCAGLIHCGVTDHLRKRQEKLDNAYQKKMEKVLEHTQAVLGGCYEYTITFETEQQESNNV